MTTVLPTTETPTVKKRIKVAKVERIEATSMHLDIDAPAGAA